MVRRIVVIMGGIGLSAVLLVLTSWLVLHFTSFGQLVQRGGPPVAVGYEQVQETYGDPFDLMEKSLAAFNYVGMPLAALMVGCFVGFLTTKGAASAAVISLVPLSIFIFAAHSFSIFGFVLALACVILAAVSSLAVVRFKSPRVFGSSL